MTKNILEPTEQRYPMKPSRTRTISEPDRLWARGICALKHRNCQNILSTRQRDGN